MNSAIRTRQQHPIAQGLRWTAMVPGALLAALVALFPVHWAVLFLTSSTTDDGLPAIGDLPPERLEAWGAAVVLPWVFVVVGAKIAPRGKVFAAGGLGLGWLLAYTAGVAILFTYIETSPDSDVRLPDWEYLQVASVVALNVAGALGGFFQVLRPED